LGFIGTWIANAAAKPIPEQAARQPVSALDFEVYRTRIEPIFLKQRKTECDATIAIPS
jgi:hypothetical protein